VTHLPRLINSLLLSLSRARSRGRNKNQFIMHKRTPQHTLKRLPLSPFNQTEFDHFFSPCFTCWVRSCMKTGGVILWVPRFCCAAVGHLARLVHETCAPYKVGWCAMSTDVACGLICSRMVPACRVGITFYFHVLVFISHGILLLVASPKVKDFRWDVPALDMTWQVR